MRCLTICQPWAWAIVHAGKHVENRTWPTPYTGPLLIHAGKSTSYLDWDDLAEWPEWYGVQPPKPADLRFGAVVGVCRLAGCVRLGTGIINGDVPAAARQRWPWLAGHPFLEGPYAWVLEDVRAFARPVPWRGAQGLFDVPDEAVREAMAEEGAPHGE